MPSSVICVDGVHAATPPSTRQNSQKNIRSG
jgi:hypothetical protein